MKLPLIVVLSEEMFIPHSGLQSSWDTIGTKLCLINAGKFLIGPNLTHNPGFTFRGMTHKVMCAAEVYKNHKLMWSQVAFLST